MKPLLVLVSSLLAVLTCRAAPAVEPVTCADDGGIAAARLALHTINQHHKHGYKFQLDKIRTSKVEQVQGECNIELMLDLNETECQIINPKHFEDCDYRNEAETNVIAACSVSVTVKDGVANVTKYSCDTKRGITDEELKKKCPDCPTLLALNNADGLKYVRKGVALVNQNVTNPRYFILMEVGRMYLGFMMGTMHHYAEFALVESHCPMGTRIVIEACVPLCCDRARHASCQSTYSISTGEQQIECEFYPPENTTAVDIEPKCGRPHRRPPPMARPGPPPFDKEQRPAGPPPHAGGRPPHPPHAGGPPPLPPHGWGPPPHPPHPGGPPPHRPCPRPGSFIDYHPFHPFHPCPQANQDGAIHPICPWPLPHCTQ